MTNGGIRQATSSRCRNGTVFQAVFISAPVLSGRITGTPSAA